MITRASHLGAPGASAVVRADHIVLGQWCLAMAIAVTMAIDVARGGAVPRISLASAQTVTAECSADDARRAGSSVAGAAEAALADVLRGRKRLQFREAFGAGRPLPAGRAGLVNSSR